MTPLSCYQIDAFLSSNINLRGDINDRDNGLIVWVDCGLAIDIKSRDGGQIVWTGCGLSIAKIMTEIMDEIKRSNLP